METKKKKLQVDLPTTNKRISRPRDYQPESLKAWDKIAALKPDWFIPFIPIIRKLVQSNQDIGQALQTVVSLGNTGHKVYFDPSVPPEQVDKMRAHLEKKQRKWAKLVPGIHGIVNRTFSQALISGAISIEWVPEKDLSGISHVVLVNPESIVFSHNSDYSGYRVFQKVMGSNLDNQDLVELNQTTYQYMAINGDGDSPYGCPPFLKSLGSVRSQKLMLDNIDFVIEQLGLLGFVSVLIDQPEIADGESITAYTARMEATLDKAKTRVQEGYRDGCMVGFKDSHEIEFNGINRDSAGALKLFENNELMLASGLNTDAAMLGRGYSTSESQITIVFTKLLSELKNAQLAQAKALEFGYRLELLLAGFDFEYLEVRFNRSTLQDEYKYQQGQEIKIRNLHQLRVDGLIGQEDYADEMDIRKPYQDEPVVPFEDQDGRGTGDQAAKDKKLEDKNKSERKTTSSKKPQGTTRKQK